MAKFIRVLAVDKFVNVSSDRLLMLNSGKNRDGWPRRGGGGENEHRGRLLSSGTRREKTGKKCIGDNEIAFRP
jgi:hypothetical protein